MRASCILIVALLFAARVFAVEATRAGDASKYYRLTSLTIGRLVFSNMELFVAPEKAQPQEPESVPVFNFIRAHVVLLGDDKKEVLSGEIVEGTPRTPSSYLVGKFKWGSGVDRQNITEIDISTLVLRLKNVTSHWTLGGADVTLPADAHVTMENEGRLSQTATHASGLLLVTEFGPSFHGIQFEWKGLRGSFSAVARATAPAEFEFDMQSGRVCVTTATVLVNAVVETDIVTPIDNLVSDERVDAGHVAMSGLTLKWIDRTPTISLKKFQITDPAITYLPMPTLPVRAVAEIDASDIAANAHVSKEAMVIDTPHSTGDLVIKPNGFSVINELNAAGKFNSTESLLPTGDPNIQFTKTSTLSALYQSLSEAERLADSTEANVVILRSHGNVLVDLRQEKIRVQNYDKPGKLSNPVALIVGNLAGHVAAHFVAELLAMVVRPEVTIYGWLTVSTYMTPQIGTAFAYRVAAVSSFLSKGWVRKFAEKSADQVAESLADHFSELILEQGLAPSAYKALGTPPPDEYVLTPRLFANLQQPPEEYYADDFATRYRTYLTAITPHRITEPENRATTALKEALHAHDAAMSKIDESTGSAEAQHAAMNIAIERNVLLPVQQQNWTTLRSVGEANQNLMAPELAQEAVRQREQQRHDDEAHNKSQSSPAPAVPDNTKDQNSPQLYIEPTAPKPDPPQ